MCILSSCLSPGSGVPVPIISKFLLFHKHFLTQPPVPSGLCFSFSSLDYIYLAISWAIASRPSSGVPSPGSWRQAPKSSAFTFQPHGRVGTGRETFRQRLGTTTRKYIQDRLRDGAPGPPPLWWRKGEHRFLRPGRLSVMAEGATASSTAWKGGPSDQSGVFEFLHRRAGLFTGSTAAMRSTAPTWCHPALNWRWWTAAGSPSRWLDTARCGTPFWRPFPPGGGHPPQKDP